MSVVQALGTLGLYTHVPFCKSKCNYCNFYSVEYGDTTAHELYKSAVIRNLKELGRLQFDTVFFGGGTPSLLYEQIAEILPSIPTIPDAEITLEANPCDVNPQMLELLKQSGVNRLSIGVQSLDDSLLRRLGRRHDSQTALKAFEYSRMAGFDNISADIMLGIPGQTLTSLRNTINALPFSQLEHISAYIYEPAVLPEDEISQMYLTTVELLECNGFTQYEISNFAKSKATVSVALPPSRSLDATAKTKATMCRHNLKYWNCEEYIGIGPAAHSYYKGKRFAVPDDVDLFVRSSTQKTYVTEENPGSFEERAMLLLRLTHGIGSDDCTPHEWQSLCERADSIPREYINMSNERISLTPKGFLISNKIIADLLY